MFVKLIITIVGCHERNTFEIHSLCADTNCTALYSLQNASNPLLRCLHMTRATACFTVTLALKLCN